MYLYVFFYNILDVMNIQKYTFHKLLNTKVHWPIPTGVAGPKLRSIHVEMNGIEAAGQLWENIHAAWW